MSSTEKPVCSYGEKCFRKNKEHVENYEHPDRPAKRLRTDAKKVTTSETTRVKETKSKATEAILTKTLPEEQKLEHEILDLKEVKGKQFDFSIHS